MKRYFYLFVILNSLYSMAFAVENCIDWHDNQKLHWSDFQGEVDEESRFAAMTYWYIYYRWHGNKVQAESCFKTDKAWVREGKETDYLLQHEQLHFDIAQLHVRLFKKRIESVSSSAQVKKIFDEVLRAAKQMQAKYDEESEHSRNKAAQKRWNQWIADKLEELEDYSFERLITVNSKKKEVTPDNSNQNNRSGKHAFNASGVWDSDFGTLTLQQRGNKVSGTYHYVEDQEQVYGTVSGTLSQKTLRGTWQEGDDSGELLLKFSENGLSFSGTWQGEDEAGEWSGTRE